MSIEKNIAEIRGEKRHRWYTRVRRMGVGRLSIGDSQGTRWKKEKRKMTS